MGAACSCEQQDIEPFEVVEAASYGWDEKLPNERKVSLEREGTDAGSGIVETNSTACSSNFSPVPTPPLTQDILSPLAEEISATTAVDDSTGTIPQQGSTAPEGAIDADEVFASEEKAEEKKQQGPRPPLRGRSLRQRQWQIGQRLPRLLGRRPNPSEKEGAIAAGATAGDVVKGAAALPCSPAVHFDSNPSPRQEAEIAKEKPAPTAAILDPPTSAHFEAITTGATMTTCSCSGSPSCDTDGSPDGSIDRAAAAASADSGCVVAAPGCERAVDVESVMEVCRGCLSSGDIFGAERALLEAIGQLESAGAVGSDELGKLRASGEYASTLELLRKFEKVRALGGCAAPHNRTLSQLDVKDGEAQWRLGTEIKIDLKALGFKLDEEVAKVMQDQGDAIKVFYRLNGKQVDVRMDIDFPTRAQEGSLPLLLGWLAVWMETALWEAWHPVISKGGAVDLEPEGRLRKLWQIPISVFFQKEVAMHDVHLAFDHDAGALLMLLEGLPQGHAQWEKYPAPPRYRVSDLRVFDVGVALRPREHITSCTMMVHAEAPQPIPDVLLKWALSFFLPEVMKRMMRATAQCCSGSGPHAERVREDRQGIYAECLELVRMGAAMNQDQCHGGCCKPGHQRPHLQDGRVGATDSETTMAAARSLLTYDAKFRVARSQSDLM